MASMEFVKIWNNNALQTLKIIFQNLSNKNVVNKVKFYFYVYFDSVSSIKIYNKQQFVLCDLE